MRSKTYAKEIIPLIDQYCRDYNMAKTNKKYYYGLLCGICDAALSIGVVIIINRYIPDGSICYFTVEYTDRGEIIKNKYNTVVDRIATNQTVYEFCRGRRWYYNARNTDREV